MFQLTNCKDCLRHSECGWCALESSSSSGGGGGHGICSEGGHLSGPISGQCGLSNFTSPLISTNLVLNYNELRSETKTSWSYLVCPLEDECLNGNNDCLAESEDCVDTPDSFECDCKHGYERTNETGRCEAVCIRGCLNGVCVSPDRCECNFSFVGASCDVACLCNSNSDCLDEDNLDVCLECQNDTVGERCESCRPGFVKMAGVDGGGGRCVSCDAYCHGKTSSCFPKEELLKGGTGKPGWKVDFVSNEEHDYESIFAGQEIVEALESERSVGMTWSGGGGEDDPVCVNCGGDAVGLRCEQCRVGHFLRGSGGGGDCRPCECNGHGSVCDRASGEHCRCGNNTVSDVSACKRRSRPRNKGRIRIRVFLPKAQTSSCTKLIL